MAAAVPGCSWRVEVAVNRVAKGDVEKRHCKPSGMQPSAGSLSTQKPAAFTDTHLYKYTDSCPNHGHRDGIQDQWCSWAGYWELCRITTSLGPRHSCRPDPPLRFQVYEPINLQSVTPLFYVSYFKSVIWFWREEVLVISLGGLDLCWKVSGSLEKSRREPVCRARKWVCRLETLQRAEQEQTVTWPHTLTVIAAVKGTLRTGCFIRHLWPLPH